MREKCVDIPDEIWEQIISLLDDDSYLEPLSLVCKRFLSLTNNFKSTLKIFDPTAFFLPKLLLRFPNLKHISLSEFHGDPSLILYQISNAHLKLLSLDLSNHTSFPIEGIKALPSSSLESLRSLNLSRVSLINDCDLEVISGLLPNLEDFDLSDPNYDSNGFEIEVSGGGSGITDDGVALIASSLSNLRNVNLSGHFLITDKSVICLAEKCANLEELVVRNCSFITQTGVGFVLRGCANLKSVSLLGMDISAADISESLAFAHNLCAIEFSYMDVSDGLLYAIAKACIPLKKFTLFHCKNFTFSGILSLVRAYQCLEYFALEGAYCINDRSIIDIAKFLGSAICVKFNFCSRLTNSSLFTLIKNCPKLEMLEMEKTDLGKQEFAVNNVNNARVQALSVPSNKMLSNDCLESIASACPNLESLDVSDCPLITRKGIGEIMRNCCDLKHLLMNGCGAVKSLGMDRVLPKLEVLKASGSGLNDEGLVMIGKKCPRLMYLDVMSCYGLTSKGVKEVVKHCRRLREINLNWCRGDMSRDIIAWMVFSRPSLRKIVPPYGLVPTENEKSLFLRHGCQVCEA